MAQGGGPRAGDEEAEEELQVLDALDGINGLRRAHMAAVVNKRAKYSPEALLDQVMLGTLLRNRGQLRAVVQLSQRVGMPTVSRNMIEASATAVQSAVQLLSKAGMSRGQRIVDSAYMLWWRDDVQRRGPRYYIGMVDSSTQGYAGVDWQNSQMHYVVQADAINVHEAWRCLVGLVGRQRAAWADAIRTHGAQPGDSSVVCPVTEEEILLGACRLEVANCVRARIHEHTMPPVGLGRRATATEYKVRAWLHALSLEHGSDEAMAGALGSFVSLTTDLGAESGIADYECLRWRDFLGPWQDEVRLEADEAPRGSAPLCRGAQPEAVLPNGCVCPGVLHIIDNAFLDMDTQLPGWRGWYDGLTAILKVLSSDPLRQSFVHHCVCSGRRPDLEPKFQRTLPNLAHWRWGTLAKVLTDLLPLEGAFSCDLVHEGVPVRRSARPRQASTAGGRGVGPTSAGARRPDHGGGA